MKFSVTEIILQQHTVEQLILQSHEIIMNYGLIIIMNYH